MNKIFIIGALCVFGLLFVLDYDFSDMINYHECIDCNVILISVDTLRADHLGSYGYTRNTSQNIDRLANEGILFRNAFSQSLQTLSSHMSIFTSLYPGKHRIIYFASLYPQADEVTRSEENESLNTSIKTLPEILKLFGYKTTLFAQNQPALDLNRGFGRGFDDIHPEGLEKDSDWDAVYNWIDNNSKSKFFMFLYTNRVHDPYVVPSPFVKLYDPDYEGSIISEQNEFLERIAKLNLTGYNSIRQFYWQFVNTSNKNDVNHLIALYDAALTCCVDPSIGKLIDKLNELRIDNKTVIILTSGHGEAFGERGTFFHMSLHREVLHVPLIIKIPNSDSKTIESQVQSIDIMPTILDILGITIQYDIQGKSLMPLIRNKTKIINEYTYGYWPSMFSVRSDEWKLIKYHNGKLELFDIKNDPEEQVNVAEEYPDVVKYMKNKIDEFELSVLRTD